MEKQRENGTLVRLRKKIMQGVLGCLFAVGVMLLLPGTEIKAQASSGHDEFYLKGIRYGSYAGSGIAVVLGCDTNVTGTEVHIPAKITYNNTNYDVPGVFLYAFGRSSLRKITLEEGLWYLNNCVFDDSELTEIEIPASMSYIGHGEFQGCSQLTKIRFRGKTPPQSLESDTFAGTSGPITIEIPEAQMKQYGKLNCCRMPVLLVNIQSR